MRSRHGSSQFDALDAMDGESSFDAPAPVGALRSGLASFFHDRWRISAVFLLGLIVSTLVAMMAPLKYTADAELLLRLGREYIYKPENGESANGAPVAYDREQTLMSEARILNSRDIMDSVLTKMGDERVFPELLPSPSRRWWREQVLGRIGLKGTQPTAEARRAAAIQLFERALEAELLRGSNLMQVSFTNRDPQLAAAVLTEVIETYLDRRSVIFAGAQRGTAQTNFNARREQLSQADERLAAYKLERGIQAFSTEQGLLLSHRNGLDERRTDAQVSLARANSRAASLRDSLVQVAGDVTLSSETQRSDAVDKARSLLLDLKLKERELGSQFTDDSPAVRDVRADIARTEAYVRELQANPTRTVRSGRSPTRDAVESDLMRALADEQQSRAGSAKLAGERAVTERRLAELASSEPELNALERERRLAEENFNVAAKALRDERASTELDRERRSNVSIVQAPRPPAVGRSVAAVIFGVGVFLSLCAALLTAFFLALWRDTFLTQEEVEQTLGVPALATVHRSRL